jgi:parallel beta-helix repeat protein
VVNEKDFKKIRDQKTLRRFALSVGEKIVELDLNSLNFKHINKYADKFDDDGGIIELFMNEERMPLSRYPNEGFMTFKKTIINGGGQESKQGTWADYYGDNPPPTLPPRPGVFEYRDSHENRWANVLDRGVWLKGFWRIPWQNEAVRVSKMDTIAHTITLAVPVPGGIGNKYTRPEGNGKEPYWLMNLPEEIDLPGEWAIDFTDKKLYFYPPKTIKTGNVRIADIAEPLIQLVNASCISLIGLTIEENMHDGITIVNGENNLVAGCTVRNMTKYAIKINGGKNQVIQSNDLYNLGAGGVWLKGGDENATPKVAANFRVVNNHIYHFSQLTRVYCAGINSGYTGGGGGGHHPAVGMYIAHNLVHDTPHVGILFGSWNSVFEYNEVFDYCQVSDDMGAFYSYDSFERMGGHTFAYNFIHNTNIGDGIYFDLDHRDMHVYGNLVALFSEPKKRGTGFLFKSGSQAKKNNPQPIDCYNNLAVNCNFGFQFVSLPSVKNNISNNVSVLNGVSFRNRMLATDNKERDTTSVSGTTGENREYQDDPGFVSLKNFNFRLKSDCKIFTDLPGFKNLPIEKMGLYLDEYRKKLPSDKEIGRFDVMPASNYKSGTEILDRN